MKKLLTLFAVLLTALGVSAENYILYTTSDGKVVTPYKTGVFGANIVSNTYENGYGKILFDREVTSIGSYAFPNCFGLTSVEIPNSVTSIGERAFYGCYRLTSVEIPNSVTSIGECAFGGCYGLTSVEIPNSVTSIGYQAFWGCSRLTSVEIPTSVTSIGDAAFRGCSGLTTFSGKFASEDHRCLILDGTLNSFARAGLTSYVIPNSVTTIGEWAFHGCSSLTSVEIPNSVTSIGGYAFQNCSGLTSVEIPNSVTSIGNNPFRRCTSMTNFSGKFASRDHRCLIVDGELKSFASAGLTSYSIPNSVTSIGYDAFYNCSGLTSVEIPNSVTSIGFEAFEGCNSLTSVEIPNSVTTIGGWAFSGCKSLTEITSLNPTPPNTGLSCFTGVPTSTCVLRVPKGSKDLYAAADEWKDFKNITVMKNTATTCVDVLRADMLTATNSTYKGFSNVKATSEAIYAGQSATSDGAIQLRSSNSNSGIVTTASGGHVSKVAVQWNTNTASGRKLNIYGSNTPYTSASDLYGSNAGTLLGTIVYGRSTKLVITDEYKYIGLRSSSGAMYLYQINITWTSPKDYTYFTPDADKYYTLGTARGYMPAGEEKTNGAIRAVSSADDAGRFRITGSEGEYTIYNASLKKYLSANGSQDIYVSKPDGTFSIHASTDEDVKRGREGTWIIKSNETDNWIMFNEVPNFLYAQSWKTVDDGDQWTIEEIRPTYTLTFKVDDEVIKTERLKEGAAIVCPDVPEKEGYTFSGWSEHPETMPAHDVTITGSYTVNSYDVIYMVLDEEWLRQTYQYGATIAAPDTPVVDGYTFVGWNNLPETMPAHDVTVNAVMEKETNYFTHDPDKLYTLRTARGYMPRGESEIYGTEKFAEVGVFRIAKADGGYTIYNPMLGKYLSASGQRAYSDQPDGIFTIYDAREESDAATEGAWIIKSNVTGNWLMFNGSKQYCYNDGWKTVDDGDQWYIEESPFVPAGEAAGTGQSGDINGDGRVDVLDVTTLIDMILGK